MTDTTSIANRRTVVTVHIAVFVVRQPAKMEPIIGAGDSVLLSTLRNSSSIKNDTVINK